MFASKTIAAGILALGTLVAAAPASAGNSVTVGIHVGPGYHHAPGWHDVRHDRRHTLSPQQVRRILRSKGYREIRFLDRRGNIYQARAEDYRGRDYRLVVSARTGAILDRDRIRGRH